MEIVGLKAAVLLVFRASEKRALVRSGRAHHSVGSGQLCWQHRLVHRWGRSVAGGLVHSLLQRLGGSW